MRRPLLATAALVAMVLLGQTAATAVESTAYVATIKTAKGSYRALVRNPEMAERARREVAGEAEAGVPIGALAWGDGGVNWGHMWHVTELEFADVTIELCDGTVRMVDRDPAYWVNTVGSFCPWSGEVVQLRPLRNRGR